MENIKKTNSGQIALVVLVISAIIMTLGLSVAKKSVVETKITTDEELLKKAFNTAESGVDYYLKTNKVGYTAADGSQAKITVSDIGGSNIANLNVLTLANDLSYTWLVGHNDDGSINLGQKFSGSGLSLCVDSAFTGSLKVDYFYKDIDNNYGVKRMGFNVNSSLVAGYTPVSGASAGCTGLNSTRSIILTGWPVSGTSLLLVVKPIGMSTKVAVAGVGDTFPDQAKKIDSRGTAGDVQTGVNQNVKVINQYQLPAFMLETITAGGDVTSNL